MNTTRNSTASAEWRAYWPLPFAAAAGMATAAVHTYSLGIFMKPLQEAFGWGRADISLGLSIAVVISAVFSFFVGLAVDRVGPRIIGIIGVVTVTGGVSLLGTATGTLLNWYLLWVIISLGLCGILPSVWSSAVNSRFFASRGLALAITLCGGAVASSLVPMSSAWLLESYGWRLGYAGLGALWAAIILPPVLLFFRGANDGAERRARQAASATTTAETGVATAALPGLSVREALRGSALYKQMVAGGCYSLTLVGLIFHLAPILQDRGMTPMAAAANVGLVGIFSIIGRISTGALLDRFPSNIVGALSYVLPTLACVLLLLPGAGTPALIGAVVVLGLAVGSELDVITYLASRHFGMRHYTALFGVVYIPIAVGSAMSSYLAGLTHDLTGTYTLFIQLSIAGMLIGALALFTLGKPPVWEDETGPAERGSAPH
jgi:MFS family permease